MLKITLLNLLEKIKEDKIFISIFLNNCNVLEKVYIKDIKDDFVVFEKEKTNELYFIIISNIQGLKYIKEAKNG